MINTIIDAKGVWKRYDAGKHKIEALRGLDLVVTRGEVVAIMGPSGCGKTTLLNCLSGLDVIDSGTIKIAGRDCRLGAHRGSRRRRRCDMSRSI